MPSSKRIAVIGAPGQLGSDLVAVGLRGGMDMVALGHDDVDVSDRESVETVIAKARAEVVIDCAAFHQVDECERDPRTAFAVNALGALWVARATRTRSGRTVYISTDYVFDGRRPFGGQTGPAGPDDAYVEADPPAPVNVYGASKLAGETLVREADPDALVVRVAGLFGRTGSRGKRGTNFVEQIVARVRGGEDLEVVDDQYVSPTYTVDAAEAILELVEGDLTGVMHVANEGACTWHAFASRCVELLGLAAGIRRIRSTDRASVAARPANTALCTRRLHETIGRPLHSWSDALHTYMREVGHLTA